MPIFPVSRAPKTSRLGMRSQSGPSRAPKAVAVRPPSYLDPHTTLRTKDRVMAGHGTRDDDRLGSHSGTAWPRRAASACDCPMAVLVSWVPGGEIIFTVCARKNDHTLPQAAGPCISKDAEDGRKTGGRGGGEGRQEGRGCGKKALPAWRIEMTDIPPCSTWRWLAPSSGPHFPFLVAQKHGSALRGVTLYFAFFCRPVEMMG